jgi:DMSO/TMAO reductase YedYZ molybdopterin-dependent catalytic subunit
VPAPAEGAPVGRRVVLGLLGLGVLGTVTGATTQRWFSDLIAPIELRDPTGLVSLLPVGNTFRYYSVTGGAPHRSAQDYRLSVTGLVERTATYTLADLQGMPQVRLVRDFQCVTGWRVPQVHWSGVRLSDLLDRAGPLPSAQALRVTSFDGTYSSNLTLQQARDHEVIVALQMLGKPVTRNHGGPVRLYTAPLYGYKSVKWLSGVELVERNEPGYWEQRGYDLDGFVGKTGGRVDAPIR